MFKETKVSMKLDVRGKTISNIVGWYYDGAIIVNRRYQRKLVWSLEEKQLFIDSILNQYPTPSIILSQGKRTGVNGECDDYYEIIDGLQRLNAIISFVRNEFGVKVDGKEYYFNLFGETHAHVRGVKGELIQKEPVLDWRVCERFADTPLPVVLTEQGDDRVEQIEKIFQRINSSGTKLSAHDMRQASSCGEFPDLVRRIATRLRGDYTYSDEINLCDMPKISLRSAGLDYGVDPKKSFWIRNGIMPFDRFRQSKDEEVIASAMAICLLGKDFRINANNLDALYQRGSKKCNDITAKVLEIGKDELEEFAVGVVSCIDKIFTSADSNFADYLYAKKNAAAKDVGFLALFCVLYQLHREGYTIENYKRVADVLREHSGSTFEILSQGSNNDNRMKVMDILDGLLRQNMIKAEPRVCTKEGSTEYYVREGSSTVHKPEQDLAEVRRKEPKSQLKGASKSSIF